MTSYKEFMEILIIEDNTEYAKLLKIMLSSEKLYTFNVTISNSLEAGIKQLNEKEKDAILLDINLPDSNGIETMRNVYNSAKNTPIIVITGGKNEKLMNEGVKLGIQDFIVKGEIGNKALVRSVIIAIERYKVYKNKFIFSQFSSDEEYFQKIIKNNADAMLVLDRKGYVIYSNEAANELFSKSNDELTGKYFSLPADTAFPTEIEVINNKNEKMVYEMQTSTIELIGETAYITSFRDITERKLLEIKLRDLSNKDDITNLLNKRGFEFLADQHFKLAQRTKREFMIAFFDLDGLKTINDTYGHIEGTRSIIETSRILKKAFRSSDILARWGGDEFIVLGIETLKNSEEVIMKRLEDKIFEFNERKILPYIISISAGVSYYDPENPRSLDEIIMEADTNMYRHKNSKKKIMMQKNQSKYNSRRKMVSGIKKL